MAKEEHGCSVALCLDPRLGRGLHQREGPTLSRLRIRAAGLLQPGARRRRPTPAIYRRRRLGALALASPLSSCCRPRDARRWTDGPPARRADRAGPARGPARPLHDRGQRRPADPHGGLGARAGPGRLRLRLRAAVRGDQALRRRRRPGALPHRDADDPGAADELPDLQHPAGARPRDRGDRLGRLRHRLEPLPRPGAGGVDADRQGPRPARASSTPAPSPRRPRSGSP